MSRPRQQALFRPPKQIKSLSRRADQYEQNNQEAAQVILDDVEKYGGEDSGMVVWARSVQARKGRA